MAKRKGPSAPDEIAEDRAREHAMLRVRRRWLGGGNDVAALARGRFGSAPLIVNDLDGRPLFYEYEVTDAEGVVGAVRASASTTIGPSVMSVQVGPRRWDPTSAVERATAAAKEAHGHGRGFKVGPADLVCYSWPKVGVRLRVTLPGGIESSIIYDVGSMAPVERFGSDELEGMTAYSFYADVVEPQRELRGRRWGREEENLDIVRRGAPQLLEPEFRFDEDIRLRLVDKLRFVRPEFVPNILTKTQTVRFGPRCSPHECMELYAQQTNVYCAVATGQMILDFYKWHFTQDQIAATMGTGPGGTGQAGQIAGYEGRSNGCLVATLDESADWSEARAEIDANRPFKSGIPGHARCGAGYERTWSWAGSTFDRSLKVYDPWPWNADICDGGAITWEDWDTVTHTNFMYVRHRTSTHG